MTYLLKCLKDFVFGFPIHFLFKCALKIYSIGMVSFFGKAKVLVRGFFVAELLLRGLFLVLFTTILFDPSNTLDYESMDNNGYSLIPCSGSFGGGAHASSSQTSQCPSQELCSGCS
jgi:hypothetical protein